MTHVNPSPSQIPDDKRQTNPTISLSFCFYDWLLFLVGSLASITIIAFDLATDWLLWKIISSLWIYNQIQDGLHDSGTRAFFSQLPVLFFAFVCMATIFFIVQVTYIMIQFWLRRVQYRSKIDGILPSASILEKCSNDLVISGQLLFQSLPLTVLLFYLQLSISCDFYFMISDKPTIVLSLVSSLCSVVWNILKTIWNWGCLGQRDDYHSGLVPRLLRMFNCILLCTVFIVIVLNLIMVGPLKSNFVLPSGQLAEKVDLESWSSIDNVVLTIATDSYVAQTNALPEIDENATTSYQYHETLYANYCNVVKLKDIFTQGHASTRINFDINDTNWMQVFTSQSNNSWNKNNEAIPANCTIVLEFQNRFDNNEIMYNIGYICGAITNNNCMLKSLRAITFEVYSNQTRPRPVWSLTNNIISQSATDSDYVALAINKYEQSSTGSAEYPTRIMVVGPHVTLSWKLKNQTTPCAVSFTQDNSISLPNNIC